MTPRAFRLSVNRAAKLIFGGSDGISGRILNLSKSGARVCIWSSSWVPQRFDLIDVFSGTKRKSKVIWRSPESLGVRFVDQAAWPDPEEPTPPPVFGSRARPPQT
jgi:siroheme synthase (precorrin-2 oxidase/ferrochelatase)